MSEEFSRPLRVATRGSALALWQTRFVGQLLGVDVEEIVVRTSGEERLDVPIHRLGGQGVFVKELQSTVLEGKADFAVHSAKDLPAVTPDGLVIAAIPEREDVRDALVGSKLNDIPEGGTIGTGSVRRSSQLAALRPDLKFADLRGNIETRVKKADDFDAVVVAACALYRLGLTDLIAETLSVETLLPQVGQGALAVECRSDDSELIGFLNTVENASSRACVDAERAFLAELGGACDFPEGAYATFDSGSVSLRAVLSSLDGATVLRHQLTGSHPVSVGTAVARYLLDEAGGKELLETLREPR